MFYNKKKEVIAAYLKQQEITIICYIYISIISKFYHIIKFIINKIPRSYRKNDYFSISFVIFSHTLSTKSQ